MKVKKKSQNRRNQGFSYYFCLMIEGSGSGSRRQKTYGSYGFGSAALINTIMNVPVVPLLLEGWCGWADDLWLWGGGGGVSDDGHGALQQRRQLLVLQLLVRHVLHQSIILMLKHLTINCDGEQLHRRKSRSF